MNEKAIEKMLNPPPNGKIAAAKEFGVDLTLFPRRLSLTPQQRIEEMQIQTAQFENLRKQFRFQQRTYAENLKPTVIEIFAKNKIEFVVVGEIVAFLYNLPCGSFAFEICYSRKQENLRRIVEVLASFNPLPRGFTPNSSFVWNEQILINRTNLRLETTIGDIDLLGEIAGIGSYESVKKQSIAAGLYDCDVSVLTLKGLINAKRAAGRAKDLLVLPELEALQELLSEEE